MNPDWDAYFWPGTTVLANKLGEHDRDALAAAEYMITAARQSQIESGDIVIDRTGDGAHLQAIHTALFSDLYSWAGELRGVGISKDDAAFADPQTISSYLIDAGAVVRDTEWTRLDDDAIVERAARLYAVVNTAHPFREGNGRTAKIFVNDAIAPTGKTLDFGAISKDRWDTASRQSLPEPDGYRPRHESLIAVFSEILRTPADAVDPDIAEQARRALMIAGVDHPTPPRPTTAQQTEHLQRPQHRSHGRDSHYERD